MPDAAIQPIGPITSEQHVSPQRVADRPEEKIQHNCGPENLAATDDGPTQVISELVALVQTDPDSRAANLFRQTHNWRADIEYGWALDHARTVFSLHQAAFKDLDDKAAWAVTYVSAGTGLLAAGVATGLTTGQLSLWVAIPALPSIIVGLMAMSIASV